MSSLQKNKIPLAVVVLIFLLISPLFLWYLYPCVPLVNPGAPYFKATKKAQEKISQTPQQKLVLNFDSATQLTSLNHVPRYLLYSSNTMAVYAGKNVDQQMSPASFTKLMTSIVASDIALPGRYLSTSKASIDKIPTVLGLRLGEQFPLEDLLRASIATSANDAAATIAQSSMLPFGGNTKDFVDLMNQKAKFLDMSSTQFANPEGYDDQKQYSTLHDIAKLVNYLQTNYPKIISFAQSDREDIHMGDHHLGYYLPNWNGLLGVYPGVIGLKIAYTEDAGYSTIVIAQKGTETLVAIVSGTISIPERDLAAAALLDYGFEKTNQKPAKITRKDLQVRYQQWNDLAKLIRMQR